MGPSDKAVNDSLSGRINMPEVPNLPSEQDQSQLRTERQASSIPLAAEEVPKHQDPGQQVWIYPSEQMFYNAMKRKGWQPAEQDMGTIVAIHNAVNERAWQEVLSWERLHTQECNCPKLKKFRGRPNEFSPKARLLNYLGYKMPFDRHDWIIDRCGKDVRYVIDFYRAVPTPEHPVSMHLDVRPALDSLSAAYDRLYMQARWMTSGRWRNE